MNKKYAITYWVIAVMGITEVALSLIASYHLIKAFFIFFLNDAFQSPLTHFKMALTFAAITFLIDCFVRKYFSKTKAFHDLRDDMVKAISKLFQRG